MAPVIHPVPRVAGPADLRSLGEEELVALCRAEIPHSSSGFDEIVRRHKDLVYRTCLAKLRNHEDAEDASQETFIRVWFGLREFRGDAALATWMTRIALNVCLSSFLTKQGRFWRRFVTRDGDADLEAIYTTAVTRERETRFWITVGGVLRKMAVDYRKIFILRHFKNFSLAALVERIGPTLGAVKMKLGRAKTQFIRLLKHDL